MAANTKAKSNVLPIVTPQSALMAALADLSFDGRASFIASAPAPMLAADVDKILDVKDAAGASIWDKHNRHVKSEAARVWKAGGPVTTKSDDAAKEYAKANELMKGNWKQLSNRTLDGIIKGAEFEPAKAAAIAETKMATLAELAEKGWTKGGQLMEDAVKNHPGLKTKAAKEKAASLLEQLLKLAE